MTYKITPTPLEWVRESLSGARLIKRYKGDHRKFFEHFVKDLVTIGVQVLEKNRNRHSKANENTLTDLLIGPLLGAYTLAVEENANGHVDVVLKGGFPGIEWKGEAKIVTGYTWYRSGLVKLVNKYNSGGEDDTFLVGFYRQADMYTALGEYRSKIEKGRPARFQSWTTLSTFNYPNVIRGEHIASGRSLLVTHVWANCHYATDKAVLSAAKGRKRRSVPK